MHYKTIILELLQDRPELYERLRSSKRLLPAMDAYAIELKASHQRWMRRLSQESRGRHPALTASQALEMAVQELQDRLPCASESGEADPFTLDAAMSSIRRHTPPA